MLGLAVVMLGHHIRLTDPTLAKLTFAACPAGPLSQSAGRSPRRSSESKGS